MRTETKEEAERIQNLLREVYAEADIPVVHVPVLPVPERLRFILERL